MIFCGFMLSLHVCYRMARLSKRINFSSLSDVDSGLKSCFGRYSGFELFFGRGVGLSFCPHVSIFDKVRKINCRVCVCLVHLKIVSTAILVCRGTLSCFWTAYYSVLPYQIISKLFDKWPSYNFMAQ